jgi:hypothetical protein
MRLLRLAIETQRWELAAHLLILGTIKARQTQNGKRSSKGTKKQPEAKKA